MNYSNDIEIGTIYGMILGDGCIYLNDKKYHRLSVIHSVKQKEYLEHKANIFNQFLGVNHSVSEFTNGGHGWRNCRYQSYGKPLREIYEDIYIGGKKTYTEKILRSLTPEGLAYWWQDDGSLCMLKKKYKGRYLFNGWQLDLATWCSKSQVDLINTIFLERFNFSFRSVCVNRQTDQWVVRSSSSKLAKHFTSFIHPFIVPSMLYKVTLERKDLGNPTFF